jgi:glycosyltransferase involved in cell wall biosynthesis
MEKTLESPIKISLVTPNYNGEKFLEKTIVSVLSQNYPNLEYIIVDGKSTDASMKIIEKYASSFAHIICERDSGHADAVNKGFALASGDAMGWVNSDDMLFPGSLALVNEIFSQFSDIEWITGRATSMLESDIVNLVRDARPWSWLRFVCGDYRHIQQESTFWRRQLWERAGGRLSTRYFLANDFELWSRFFQQASLYSIDSILGSFRFREGQRSILFRQDYDEECERILEELLDSIPAHVLAKYLNLLRKDRNLHPSFNFPSVPTALGVVDPPIIRFDHAVRRFSRPSISLEPPRASVVQVIWHEDLDFDGLERVSWTDGPDFNVTDLIALDLEFWPSKSITSSVNKFDEDSPRMPVLIGPVAVYELGSGKYNVQIKYKSKSISQNVVLDDLDKKVHLKVVLGNERYAIIVNGKVLSVGDMVDRQVAQLRYARIGGGYLARYWVGKIERIVVTVHSQTAGGISDPKSSAIVHQAGKRRLPRERRDEPVVISTPLVQPFSVSSLARFKVIHSGKRCFVMGNGPSLNKMNLEKLRGETVFACNGAFLLFDRVSWKPRYYTCVDTRVIRDRAADIVHMLDTHPEIVAFFPSVVQIHDGSRREFDCRTIIPPGVNRHYFNEIQNSLLDPPRSMFSLDVDKYVVQPYTVAITMLQLAAYMGFSEIYLIGCDTDYKIHDSVKQEGKKIGDVGLLLTSTKDDDPNHFDPRYFGKGREWHNPQVSKMIEQHEWAEKALRGTQTRVFNATVGGRLEAYPRVDFESLF